MCKDRESNYEERNQYNEAASAATARTAAAETKTPFEPHEYSIEKEEFEQTS